VEADLTIRQKAAVFFSPGRLSEKISMADEIGAMSGLDLFFTPVPWLIVIDENVIPGFSENLEAAARDIHAWLSALLKAFDPGTRVNVILDESRLPAAHTMTEEG